MGFTVTGLRQELAGLILSYRMGSIPAELFVGTFIIMRLAPSNTQNIKLMEF